MKQIYQKKPWVMFITVKGIIKFSVICALFLLVGILFAAPTSKDAPVITGSDNKELFANTE